WVDRVYLSPTPGLSGSAVLLGEVSFAAPLAMGLSVSGSVTANLPQYISGNYYFVVVADATNQDNQHVGQRLASQPVSIPLAPFAALAVSNVDAPAQTIADPAQVTVTWTVTNVGTGAGRTGDWVDSVIASPDTNPDNPHAVVLKRFAHSGALGVNE